MNNKQITLITATLLTATAMGTTVHAATAKGDISGTWNDPAGQIAGYHMVGGSDVIKDGMQWYQNGHIVEQPTATEELNQPTQTELRDHFNELKAQQDVQSAKAQSMPQIAALEAQQASVGNLNNVRGSDYRQGVSNHQAYAIAKEHAAQVSTGNSQIIGLESETHTTHNASAAQNKAVAITEHDKAKLVNAKAEVSNIVPPKDRILVSKQGTIKNLKVNVNVPKYMTKGGTLPETGERNATAYVIEGITAIVAAATLAISLQRKGSYKTYK